MVRADRRAGAGLFGSTALPEVLRPMGWRNPSGADRRRRSASPAGRGDRQWRDRAELPSRLRRVRIPLELCCGTGGGAADALRRPGPPGDSRKGDLPHRLQGVAGGRDVRLPGRERAMITVVISVYKVANFPDGGGHFWVYMQ